MKGTTPELAHPLTKLSHHTGGRKGGPWVCFKVQQAQYTTDLLWNRVSNLEPSVSEANTLPLCHRGQSMIDNGVEDTFLVNLRYDTYEC
ncbi:hypothetical protein AVEN_187286-1 [Araneus ventricosus]|uniref:Uncharacterized protein n=1 Tax=Araneus ventricosus TaxID=182803 RepID=A0A4Y2GQ70_ARAVE|nr:hypothetical protein AVEN_187286-1 [Araneus ventricosus]